MRPRKALGKKNQGHPCNHKDFDRCVFRLDPSKVKVEAQEVGIVEFLIKPFAATELIAAVGRHI